MKRYEVWLALIVGIVLGLTAKSFFARDSSAGNARTVPQAKATDSAVSVTAVNEKRSESAGTPANTWVRRSLASFDEAIPNQPTPGIVDAISDALRAEPPFDQSRMITLIELMRKEDFPPVLEVLRKAKTNLHLSSSGMTGSSMWMAFWTRFGQLDPATALAKALECGDLKYNGRKYLEKGLFQGMSRNDPRAAADAFLSHPEIPNPDTAVEGIMVEWARTDTKAATAWALEHLEGGALSAAFYMATWGVCGQFDISEGNTFTKNLPPGPAQFNAIRSMKSQINQKDLPAQQILDFLEVTRAVGSRDRGFEAQMASRCAGIDPFAAANYFSQPLANGEQNDFKELSVVSALWIKADPKAAESWAKGQEGTPQYEVVANQFLRAAQERKDDAEVQRWLEAIEKQRKSKGAAQ
jgi:hypothetical protein